MITFKLSGVTHIEQLDVACRYGVHVLGFNLTPNLPNAISIDQLVMLYDQLEDDMQKILHVADADDNLLNEILSLMDFDYIEVSGNETKQRLAEIFDHTSIPIIKNIMVQELDDIWQAQQWEQAVDYLQFSIDNAHILHQCVDFDFTALEKPWVLKANIDAQDAFAAFRAIQSNFIDLSHLLQSEHLDAEELSILIAEAERAMLDG